MEDVDTTQHTTGKQPELVDKPNCLACWCLGLLIVGAGLAFRGQLLDAFFLDFDESMHFQAAREATVAGTWESCRVHTHPPLVFLFYHFWMQIGDSEQLLRLPALIFSATALLAAFLWLQLLLDTRSALVGVFFLSFSMPMIHLGAQMRGYTLLLTLILLGLYWQEKFVQRQSACSIIASGACFGLALLTHYLTAWVLLSCGITMTMRVFSGTLTRRSICVWAAVQVTLLCACALLFRGHVQGFVDSQAQTDLWSFWLRDSAFDANTTGSLRLAIGHLCEFLAFVSGSWWKVFALCVLGGTLLLSHQTRETSFLVRLERAGLVFVPLTLAMLLFHMRIYPLGHTRHSMWLIPFATAALASALGPIVNRPTSAGRIGLLVVGVLWVQSTAISSVWQLQTTQTPNLARETVKLIRDTVQINELILTDDSTRNVLEYYLAKHPTRPKTLAGGYTEYQMSGFRIITIPKFHFFMYDMKADWNDFQSALRQHATKPIWVLYFGFETPDNDLKNIYTRFPPGGLITSHSYKDNHLLRVQFKTPIRRTGRSNNPTQVLSNKPQER